MKFTLVSAILAAVTSLASASIQAADGQLNITSPLDNGQYVAGQILPIIYTPAGNPSSKFEIPPRIIKKKLIHILHRLAS